MANSAATISPKPFRLISPSLEKPTRVFNPPNFSVPSIRRQSFPARGIALLPVLGRRPFSLKINSRPHARRLKQPLKNSFLKRKFQAQGQKRAQVAQISKMGSLREIQKLIGGSDRSGIGFQEIAIELRHLGVMDLWVKDARVPGAFRRPEELIALVVAPRSLTRASSKQCRQYLHGTRSIRFCFMALDSQAVHGHADGWGG